MKERSRNGEIGSELFYKSTQRRASGRNRNGGSEMKLNKRMLLTSIATGFALAVAGPALAQKKYDPGASDTEIKIGNIMPYCGPASAYGTIGKAHRRLFQA